MTKKLTDTIAIIGPVRLSYMNVFKPRLNKQRGAEEYSVTLLFEKDDLNKLKDVRELVETALKEKFKEVPKKYETCLKDGDTETDNEGNPKHPGYWFIATRSATDYPPVLIDGARKPVIDEKAWVSGDYGNVKLSFFGYDFDGKKGVSTSLRAIQFTKKGEPFGASTDPESVANEFDEVEEDFLA